MSITITNNDGDALELFEYRNAKILGLKPRDNDGDGYISIWEPDVVQLRDACERVLGDTKVVSDDEDDETLAKLRLAVNYECRVKFEYDKPSGIRRSARLEPDTLQRNKDGAWVVGGYDDVADEYRQFRVDRIVGEVAVR